MPHIIVTSYANRNVTFVGDEHSDPHLMAKLGAVKRKVPLLNRYYYEAPMSPRIVLDLLEAEGYKIIGMAGTASSVWWTLNKSVECKE